MSSADPVLFPCPRCGVSRPGADAPCKSCDWQEGMMLPAKHVVNPPTMLWATVLGLLTFLPLVYVVFFFTIIMLTITELGDPGIDFFVVMMIAHFLVILLSWGLTGYFLYYLFSTDFVKQDQKVLWAVILFLGHMMAFPFFWYLYVWKPANESS